MLASGLVLGVAAGLLSGGTLRRLGELRIAWWPLLAIAVTVRVLAPVFGEFAAAAYVVAFSGVALVALLERRLPGMPLLAAGAVLNLVVVAANGGMPVDQKAVAAAGAVMSDDRLHLVLDDSTRVAVLADRIPVSLFRSVYSVGDVLLAVGGFWIPFMWMRRG